MYINHILFLELRPLLSKKSSLEGFIDFPLLCLFTSLLLLTVLMSRTPGDNDVEDAKISSISFVVSKHNN